MAERAYKRIAVEEGFNFPEIMSEAVKVAAQQPPLIKALNPFGGSGGLWEALGAKLGDLGEGRIQHRHRAGFERHHERQLGFVVAGELQHRVDVDAMGR